MITSFDGKIGLNPSPTYSTYYTPNASPMHQMMPMSPCPRSDKYPTLPAFVPYISSPLTSSSHKEEYDNQFATVKKKEREENEEEIGDKIKPIKTKKRKFYLNQISKERDADISYHRKKFDVMLKLEQYRYD